MKQNFSTTNLLTIGFALLLAGFYFSLSSFEYICENTYNFALRLFGGVTILVFSNFCVKCALSRGDEDE